MPAERDAQTINMSKSLKRAFIVIGLFFLCLFVAIGYTLTLAFRTHQPLVKERYYETGLDYQKRLDALERGREQGYAIQSAILGAKQVSRETPRLEWKLVNTQGRAIESAEFMVVFDRPASTKQQRVYRFDLSNGEKVNETTYAFATDIELPASGYWEVKFDGSVNGDADVFARSRFFAQ